MIKVNESKEGKEEERMKGMNKRRNSIHTYWKLIE
jgi:hypothetical protein